MNPGSKILFLHLIRLYFYFNWLMNCSTSSNIIIISDAEHSSTGIISFINASVRLQSIVRLIRGFSVLVRWYTWFFCSISKLMNLTDSRSLLKLMMRVTEVQSPILSYPGFFYSFPQKAINTRDTFLIGIGPILLPVFFEYFLNNR
jgi:hypothetical protein